MNTFKKFHCIFIMRLGKSSLFAAMIALFNMHYMESFEYGYSHEDKNVSRSKQLKSD